MTELASLTFTAIDGINMKLSFDVFKTDRGGLPIVGEPQEEELKTPGVDGRRFRRIYSLQRPFNVQTAMGAASYQDGVDKLQNHIRAKGRMATLALAAGGSNFTNNLVKIIDVTSVVGNGSFISSGTVQPSYVLATWNMVMYGEGL